MSPLGLFRDNLQHWLEDLSRLRKVQFTSNEGMSNDAPIHECESDIDHYTGHVLFTKKRRVPGATPIHYLYEYVPPNGVVILKLLINLERGIHFRGVF